MRATARPGYDTDVRHLDARYRIRTEDLGPARPEIWTLLLDDGEHHVASTRTSYAEHAGTAPCAAAVKQLMRESHKAMFIALREGRFDGQRVRSRRS